MWLRKRDDRILRAGEEEFLVTMLDGKGIAVIIWKGVAAVH
jgi:hypothetical protein